ncbi:MAG: hypothetical protein ACR2P2_20890 [Nakamurella sp.]
MSRAFNATRQRKASEVTIVRMVIRVVASGTWLYDGKVYYARYRPGWEPGELFWPDSVGFMSPADAKTAAETELPGPVRWN